MHQQWLTVLGLGIDFVGFCLLLREWWLAFFHDESELRRAERLRWEQSLRQFSHAHMSESLRTHAQTSARLHDEMEARNAHARASATLLKRKRMFITATVLIVAGLAFQMVGSVPGCCPPFVTPQ